MQVELLRLLAKGASLDFIIIQKVIQNVPHILGLGVEKLVRIRSRVYNTYECRAVSFCKTLTAILVDRNHPLNLAKTQFKNLVLG